MKTTGKLSLLALFIWTSSSLAFGQIQGQRSTDKTSDRLDLKRLEDSYWAAKDTDFSVVQNRTYTKKGRFFGSLSYGPLINDPWYVGRQTGFSVGYYFNERWGVELNHELGSLEDGESTKATFTAGGAPDRNKFLDYTSLNLVIVPFYAKMSFWDRKIMYFDMQFAVGVGQMNYEQQKVTGTLGNEIAIHEKQSAIGFNLDVTQQLFFHENFAFRLDLKNKFSPQDKRKYRGNNNNSLGEEIVNDTSLLFGLTIFY
jgi:outer membrane beta-barrel protein